METKPFSAPRDFTAKFPRYVYRSGKGQETVQWREAALDMANDRERLIAALRDAIAMTRPEDVESQVFKSNLALLREISGCEYVSDKERK